MVAVTVESSLGDSGVSSSGTDALMSLQMGSSPFVYNVRVSWISNGTIPTKRLLDDMFDRK